MLLFILSSNNNDKTNFLRFYLGKVWKVNVNRDEIWHIAPGKSLRRSSGVWQKQPMKVFQKIAVLICQLANISGSWSAKHYFLEEFEMETNRKKIEGQSTKDKKVASSAVQIVIEEEYIELFGTGSDEETFLWRLEWDWVREGRADNKGTECIRIQHRGWEARRNDENSSPHRMLVHAYIYDFSNFIPIKSSPIIL